MEMFYIGFSFHTFAFKLDLTELCHLCIFRLYGRQIRTCHALYLREHNVQEHKIKFVRENPQNAVYWRLKPAKC